MSEERVIVVVPQLVLVGASRVVGDLVFTSKQVFLARTGSVDLAEATGSIGPAVAALLKKETSQKFRNQPLGRTLTAADSRTRFEYRELERIVVRPGGFFRSPTVRLIPHHGRNLRFRGERGSLATLAAAAPLLAGAGAPVFLS